MSSLKMTFSLASLILIFAFAAMPVMAHEGSVGNNNHPHPLTDTLPAVNLNPLDDSDTDDPGEAEIAPHNTHPRVASIVAKPDADDATLRTSDDGNVILLNAAGDAALVLGDGNGAGIFIVRVTFTGPLATGAELATGEVALTARRPDGTPITGITVTAVAVVADTDNLEWDVTISVPEGDWSTDDANGDGTADDFGVTLPIEVFVNINADAVIGATVVDGGGNTLTGSSSYATADATKFTVLEELDDLPPPDPEMVAPTVMITVADALNAMGEAVFTLKFSEALGTAANDLQIGDIDIDGGTAMADDLTKGADGVTYTLNVTPDDADNPSISVTLNADSVADAAGNFIDLTGTEPAIFDKTAPTVMITPPMEPDADGNLMFTFTFSEEIEMFETEDIDRAGSGNELLGPDSDPMQDDMDPAVWTVLVTPEDPTMPTSILILKGSVEDKGGNGLAGDARATYTPSGADPGVPDPTIAGPDTLSCLTGGMITVTFDEALKADEALAMGDIELTGAGWEITNFSAADGTFNLMPKADRSWIGTTKVTVKVKAGVVVDADDQGNTEETMDFTVGPVLTISAGGYIVVIRENAQNRSHLFDAAANRLYFVGDPQVGSRDVAVQTWDCMPDLGVRLGRVNYNYDRGGTLVVDSGGGLIVKQSADHMADADVANSGTIGAGTVGITEIMWAVDRSELFGARRNFEQAREQWIELHNLNNFEVKVTLFDLIRDEAYSNKDYGEVDRMTNYNLPQFHGQWPIRDANRGQDGDSDYGEDFVAMQRGPANLAKNYLHGDFDGRNGGKWTKATAVYLTRRADPNIISSGLIDVNNFTYDFIGTPGRSNNIGTANPPGVTGVPHKPFVINEVGNRNNRLYDWIELRNTSGAEANLRNYQLSIVTAVDSDNAIFTFPNSDIKLADNEVILVLASDPEDDGEHPIAVGYDVLGGNDQAPGLGDSPAKYIVSKRNERLYTEGLPSENFVLILRRSEKVDAANAHTKLKTHEWIIDVAGYDTDLGNRNAGPKYTALWPLNGHGAPFSKNNLKAEGVYFRRDPGRLHGENNNDKPAFVAVGYTGVGYRRHAQNSPAHGGTPGYNDIRKNLAADVKGGTVTISEIMFDQGDRGTYPQWIELYNSSATEAVNLHADDGWRLVVENYDDGKIPVGQISGTLNFKKSEVQTILPQQTVLVVSTRSRTIGSRTVNASVVFIPTRVFSVWSDARGELAMGRSTDPILSETGFHIELIDGKGNSVDEVGNLTKRRGRVAAQTIWEWSTVQDAATIEGGARSSVIRRYWEYQDGKPRRRYADADVMAMGVTAEGWVSAHKTAMRFVSQTWYGHDDDIGTPGTTAGRPLPVSLSKFRPERLKDTGEIVIRWITESELNNAGFNILRSETRDGEFTKINTKLIAGHGTTSERHVYEWKDASAKPNVTYYYQIQDVSLDGQVTNLATTHLRGNVTAAGKATTTWGEIKALQ